ncbi:hypothetical protein, partial [Methanobrevibacter cuticularis]|uniref:hypothetical protein n=1 Tax=Methanobrevibacter cuticularis TaxID=47311 RepID=UPI000A84ABA5
MKRINYFLALIFTLLIILVFINGISAATYTISTSNSTSSIDAFLSDEDWENPSPLANGDTVIFKAGKYNLDLNVNKDITLKTIGKVTVKDILISKNTKVSGFIVNGDFRGGKSNIISKNTIRGHLSVFGGSNVINSNIIKGSIWVYGIKNIINSNNIFQESFIYGGKNKVIYNKFRKNIVIGENKNKIISNKVVSNYKIITSGKKNIVKNNKESYRDLALIDVGKSSKGHILSVKNVGTKSSLACYIKIDNYDRTVYKIKVPALKKGKSTKVLIPKRIINKLKYRYYETTYYGGYIYLDYKNKNKDADLSDNRLD